SRGGEALQRDQRRLRRPGCRLRGEARRAAEHARRDRALLLSALDLAVDRALPGRGPQPGPARATGRVDAHADARLRLAGAGPLVRHRLARDPGAGRPRANAGVVTPRRVWPISRLLGQFPCGDSPSIFDAVRVLQRIRDATPRTV